MLDGIPAFGFTGGSLAFTNTHALPNVAIEATDVTLTVSGSLNFGTGTPNLVSDFPTLIPEFSVSGNASITAGGLLSLPTFAVDGLGASVYSFVSAQQVTVTQLQLSIHAM